MFFFHLTHWVKDKVQENFIFSMSETKLKHVFLHVSEEKNKCSGHFWEIFSRFFITCGIKLKKKQSSGGFFFTLISQFWKNISKFSYVWNKTEIFFLFKFQCKICNFQWKRSEKYFPDWNKTVWRCFFPFMKHLCAKFQDLFFFMWTKKMYFFNVNVFYFLIDVFHSEHSVFRKFYFMSETDRIEHFSWKRFRNFTWKKNKIISCNISVNLKKNVLFDLWRRFGIHLKCFVDWETSPDVPSAWTRSWRLLQQLN